MGESVESIGTGVQVDDDTVAAQDVGDDTKQHSKGKSKKKAKKMGAN
jgi:hypothetical protein